MQYLEHLDVARGSYSMRDTNTIARRWIGMHTQLVWTSFLLLGVPLTSRGADSLSAALIEGIPKLDMRYRYEQVDQEGTPRDAHANTLRTRLGYQTGSFYGFAAYLEGENITVIGSEDFNDGNNNKTRFPLVPDPPVTEVNQAYLDYDGIPGTTLRIGRQVITYDNRRFIGDMGWRQNQQSYDAVALVNKLLPDTTISYAYLYNSNTIFGDDNPTKGDARLNTHLLNVNYKGLPWGTLVAYGYWLEFLNDPVPSFTQTRDFSSQTYGLRFTGLQALSSSLNLLYTAEYAHQWDLGNNPNELNESYYFAELGTEFKVGGPISSIVTKVGYEVLGGDGSVGQTQKAFQTPLDTVHPFQGWANRFAIIPGTGVEDVYASVGANVYGVQAQAVFHYFEAEKGATHFGNEYDFVVAKTWSEKVYEVPISYTLGVKYAFYDGDKDLLGSSAANFADDTEKLWFFAELKF